MENEQDDVIVDVEAESNEYEVEETTESHQPEVKAEKPKRTPQEEYEYYNGRAQRLAKKLGIGEKSNEVAKDTPTTKPNDLDYGQLALLRTEGIKGSGEIALFKEIMSETGKGVLDVLDSNYFKSRLNDFRESQEHANAIPKGKNRSAQAGVTDLDVAYAKYKETGQMPQDFKTRVAIKNRIVESEQVQNMFTGPSVIGPQGQSY